MKYDIWVTPVTYEGREFPLEPTPEQAGLDKNLNYLVLSVYDNGDMASESYFLVINEKGEPWFLSNRHFRVTSVRKDSMPIITIEDRVDMTNEEMLYYNTNERD